MPSNAALKRSVYLFSPSVCEFEVDIYSLRLIPCLRKFGIRFFAYSPLACVQIYLFPSSPTLTFCNQWWSLSWSNYDFGRYGQRTSRKSLGPENIDDGR